MLTPPSIRRSRASSTGIRPPLSIHSLHHINRPIASDSPVSESRATTTISTTTTFKSILSNLILLFHFPSSTSNSNYILPLSASHLKSTFDIHLTIPHSHPTPQHKILILITFILSLFSLSTALVLFTLTTLPINFSWPHTLSDLANLGHQLNAYASSGITQTFHVIAVLSVSAIWKHAWSIPGSVLWNVLAGALFHPLLATILLTTLTTAGSILSTLLAAPLAPLITRFFPRPLELTRLALEGSTTPSTQTDTDSNALIATSSKSNSSAWVRLSILRLVGIVPWSGLNVACGLTGVSLFDCALGAFIGTLPWTAVTCHIGDILQTFVTVSSDGTGLSASTTESQSISSVLTSPKVLSELVIFSVLSIAPILARQRLAKLIGLGPSSPESSQRDDPTIVLFSEGEDEIKPTLFDADYDDPVLDEKIQSIVNDPSASIGIFPVRLRPIRWYNSLLGRVASIWISPAHEKIDGSAVVPLDAGFCSTLKGQQ